VGSWFSWFKKTLGLDIAPNRAYSTALLVAQEKGVKVWMREFRKTWVDPGKTQEANKKLLDSASFPDSFREVLGMWFSKYSKKTGSITQDSVQQLLNELDLTAASAEDLFRKVDVDNNNSIDLEEFEELFKHLALIPENYKDKNARASLRASVKVVPKPEEASVEVEDDQEDEEVEEEHVPEEFSELHPDEMVQAILYKACLQMAAGTLLVLVFSDPMVDVLGEIGKQTGFPAFYISFILAPLASNSSELVSAFNYASRKTSKTITISLSTLEGAACMNNTFGLAITMGLIYFQGLAWNP